MLKTEKKEVDVPIEADFIWCLAELVEAEAHALLSSVGDPKFFEVANAISEIRIKHLKKLAKFGHETYCMTKHMLSALKRSSEVSTKYAREHKIEKAREMMENTITIFQTIMTVIRYLRKKAEAPK